MVAAVGVLVFAGPASASPQQAGVQVALRALGLYLGPIDGQVGPLTRAAVAEAQRRAGLPPTGRIDTHTRDALGPLGRPLFGRRPIVPGDFGLDVSVLQFLLARAGLYTARSTATSGRSSRRRCAPSSAAPASPSTASRAPRRCDARRAHASPPSRRRGSSTSSSPATR